MSLSSESLFDEDKGNRRGAENAEDRRGNYLCGPPRSLRLCGYPCLRETNSLNLVTIP
jgi:hypothetical protein